MIEVVVPCSCPGQPHEQDTVSLAPVADVRIGSSAMAAVNNSPATIEDMEGAISAAWLHAGPRAWTFTHLVTDPKTGKEQEEPLPLTSANIDARLTWANGGREVALRANELYAGDVFSPLAPRKSKASRSGRTARSTSRTRTSGPSTPSSDTPSLRAVTGGKRSAARAS